MTSGVICFIWSNFCAHGFQLIIFLHLLKFSSLVCLSTDVAKTYRYLDDVGKLKIIVEQFPGSIFVLNSHI